MEDQLITFDTARLAYKKGFTNPNKGTIVPMYCADFTLSHEKLGYQNELPNPFDTGFILAPTQYVLQKWLREENFLYVEISRSHFDGYLGIAVFKCNVIDGNHDTVKGKLYAIKTKEYMLEFNSYEEALEVGLYEALKLIPNG